MSAQNKTVDLALPGGPRVIAFLWPNGKAVVAVDPAKFPDGGMAEAVAATLREVRSR